MPIKAVLFDMGNTLVRYSYEFPEEVFHRILKSLGLHRSLGEIRQAFSDAENEAKEANLLSSFGKIECKEYWNLCNSLVMKHLGFPNHFELAGIVHSEWFSFVGATLFPEVNEILSKIKKRKLKTGVISTAYVEEIEVILTMVGLGKTVFDLIVGVDTVNEAKPSSKIFEYALTHLRVKPCEALFVGDSVEADYKGALNAGMNALLLDRSDKKSDDLDTIKSLREILPRIDEYFQLTKG